MTRRAGLVVALGAAQSLVYLWLSHAPPTPGHLLPRTWLDDAIPFWPWSIWPYLILLASDVVWPFFVRDRRVFREGLTAYVISVGLMFAIFLAWPTRIERVSRPDVGGLTGFAWRWLLSADGDNGCCPSGHIIVPAVGCWVLCRDRGWRAAWVVVAFALLAPSILTTKQHYAVDLPAGLATAAVGIVIARWLTRRTPG